MPRARRIRILATATVLVAVAALIVPALAAAARDRPDAAAAARAVGRYYASFGAGGGPAPDRAAAARAVGRYYASFRDERPIPPPPVATVAPRPLPGPDGPTWVAAVFGGALAAFTAACLGVVAGRRSIRVRHG